MIEFTEKRKDVRHKHKSPVMIQDSDSGTGYRGRMINFGNHGLFLETSADFEAGTKFFIGIENSPFHASTYENPDGYIAKIMWQQDIQDTIFDPAPCEWFWQGRLKQSVSLKMH